MPRPSVDVVVPFRGAPALLEELRASLAGLELRPGDTLVVVDNTPGRGRGGDEPGVPVLHAAEVPTPGFARNAGAARGRAEWLLFLDADVVPPPDLLERYFDPPPGERTGLVAGGMRDEPVPPGGPAAARWAYLRELMSQEDSFRLGSWGFPKAANTACRREAFEAVRGFRARLRAGEDADLTYRLRAAGWEIERREGAMVVHRSRQTVRGFAKQKAIHGAGGAWLARKYPGTFPARRRPGLVWWGVRAAAKGLLGAARTRDRDRALWALFDPLELIAFEFGRSLPNERPLFARALAMPRALAQLLHLFRLPPRVAWFYLRAVVRALRLGDRGSLRVSSRPREVAALLRAARGRRRVVEHGTATAWTAVALALADPQRRVATYDPVDVPHRSSYLELAPPAVRERIELVPRPAQEPLGHHGGTELLFLDGTHQRGELVRDFALWRPLLAPGALVAFHDYDDPAWPGVSEAVSELDLAGEAHGTLFVGRDRPTASL